MKEKDRFIIPDHGEPAWTTGSETFTRQEVFSMLWTQRAMISNDIKRSISAQDYKLEAVQIVMEVLKNPRIPKF